MYRIIHNKEYNSYRDVSSQWWLVQCYKKKWWTFGNFRWFTEQQEIADWSGGTHYVDLKFYSESEAFEYIGRIQQKVPQDKIVTEPVCSYI